MGKLDALLGIFGLQMAAKAVENQEQIQDAQILEDGTLQQEPGSLTTLDATAVQLGVSEDGRQVRVQQRNEIPNVRKMGGEEIQPGTLH